MDTDNTDYWVPDAFFHGLCKQDHHNVGVHTHTHRNELGYSPPSRTVLLLSSLKPWPERWLKTRWWIWITCPHIKIIIRNPLKLTSTSTHWWQRVWFLLGTLGFRINLISYYRASKIIKQRQESLCLKAVNIVASQFEGSGFESTDCRSTNFPIWELSIDRDPIPENDVH